MPDLTELVQPASCALLVVDMQNDFCHSEGALAAYGGDPRLIQAMAPRLRDLLQTARQMPLPIIHIRTLHSAWTDSAAWLGRFSRPVEICRPASWGADYFDGFAPREPAEYVVTKHRYSGFVGTDLDLVLRSRGIRSVVLTGEASNVCVESTARDAYMHDYQVVLVSDCTAATVESAHEATLYTIGKHFGTVVTATELIDAWQRAGVLRKSPTPSGAW